jgi:hypothetical protein
MKCWIQEAAINNENLFDHLMEATKVCSLGQITAALFEVGSEGRKLWEDHFCCKSVWIVYPDVYWDLLLKKPHLWKVFILIIAKIAIVHKKPSFMGFSLWYFIKVAYITILKTQYRLKIKYINNQKEVFLSE